MSAHVYTYPCLRFSVRWRWRNSFGSSPLAPPQQCAYEFGYGKITGGNCRSLQRSFSPYTQTYHVVPYDKWVGTPTRLVSIILLQLYVLKTFHKMIKTIISVEKKTITQIFFIGRCYIYFIGIINRLCLHRNQKVLAHVLWNGFPIFFFYFSK